ncbi:ATPase domain-containing protein [Tautonia plasticadhaerens]|uniref:non-specific serine/threonine protein kinase n=1 Tax=Tautonia plasticadhaerens TaxID=2527974 RepID=A0A518HF88_9BACT|nr:ATPase domain-containing protein [Tautonia plasticadhaerens]QDV39501.1 Circadian clock protein kinase KaiC [Tautonia plasticadhaerens]
MQVEWATTGVEGLDQVLGGGLPRENVYLVQGASGSGKTTLGLQFLLEGLRLGESALYVGTSETRQTLAAIARGHGWSLDGIGVHLHDGRDSGSAEVEQTMLHPAEVELPRTVEAMLEVVDALKPDRLVIDSLAELRAMAREDRWYRRQLRMLQDHFRDSRCTALLVEIPEGDRPAIKSIVGGTIELDSTTPAYGPDRRRLRVAKIRGQGFATGYHDYKIRRGGLVVYPRLVAAEHRQRFEPERISSGLPALDAMLGGGIDRGTSTLLLGQAGTGKSLIATHYAVAAADRGERSALYLFDERIQTLEQRSEGVGLPLRRLVDEGLVEIRQVDPSELTPGEFSHLVRQSVEDRGVRLVVIDSLNGYSQAMPEERFLTVYLHELSCFLNQQGVASLYVLAQHGIGSMLTPQEFDVSYIADSVLLFRHFEHAGAIRKAISVYKHRTSAHETTIRELRVGAGGIAIGEPLLAFRGVLTGCPDYVARTLEPPGTDRGDGTDGR